MANHHPHPCKKLVAVPGFQRRLPCDLGDRHVSPCRVSPATWFDALNADYELLHVALIEIAAMSPAGSDCGDRARTALESLKDEERSNG